MKQILFILALLPVFSLSAADRLQELNEGNQRFIANKRTHQELTLEQRKALAQQQAPFATILTCSDSRVPPEIIFDQHANDLFVVRIAGNVPDQFGLGSIEYGVGQLGTPLLIILGHQRCGAVKAAMKINQEEFSANIAALLSSISPAVRGIPHSFPKLSEAEQLDMAVKNNVQNTHYEILIKSPVVRQLVKAGQLTILEGVFYIDTGQVVWQNQ